MEIKTYEESLKKIKAKGLNNEEKKVNKLFLDFNFNFIDCNSKFYRAGEEIGEIDGIFTLGDDYLFLIEVGKEKGSDRSEKITKFLSKWSSEENLNEILKNKKIKKEIKIIRIYVDFYENGTKVGLNKASLQHLNEETNKIIYGEDIEYYIKSYALIGSFAKNELLFDLDLKPLKKNYEDKDAIRIPLGNKMAFLFHATAEELLNTSYIYRKKESSLDGYQRILKPNRVNKIREAIQKEKILAFPNSIILSSREKLCAGFDKSPGICKIKMPNSYLSFKVVDGQHRLMGFSKLDKNLREDHHLPVVAFEDLNKTDELQTFITINTEQKKIDPNLLLILKADIDLEEKDKFFIEKQAVLIIKKLNNDKNFFLKNRIFLGYNEIKGAKITLTTLVSAIKKNNLICGKYHLLQTNISEIDKPYREIKKILISARKSLRSFCNLKKTKKADSFFLSNNGLRVLFRLIQFFLRNKNKKYVSSEENYDSFFKDVSEVLSGEDVEELMKDFGEGGFSNATSKIIKKLKASKKEKYKKFKEDLRKL